MSVQVGDVGTVYRCKITDQGVPFDPTTATVKELIFQLPQGTVVADAQVESEGGDYFLVYTVTDPTFHAQSGYLKLQAHVVLGAAEYHSSIQTVTTNGTLLCIYPNLT